MEEEVILKVVMKDGEAIVQGGGSNIPPLVLVGLLEKVKMDILLDIDSRHQSGPTPMTSYDA